MASESAGEEQDKRTGHRNHFRLLQEEGLSWSGREPNTLFQNRGDGTFDEVGNVLGLYLRLDSRGAAAADFDGDGDLDLAVYNRNNPILKIYRNDTPGQGNVLQVDLRGVNSEPMAAGAQVTARCDGRRFLRQVELGSGFLSQSPPRLHFGLGSCREVEELAIVWPSGATLTVEGVAVNQRLSLVEGEDGLEAVPLEPRNYNRSQLAPSLGELSAVTPELVFRTLDGQGELALADLRRETAVVNFWATWCTACVLEMPDLERLSRDHPDVRFIGVAMDEDKTAEDVAAFARERGVTYAQVWGTVEDQRPFSSLGSSPPGAIPLTAVLHEGTVRSVYVGQIDAEELGRLLALLGAS